MTTNNLLSLSLSLSLPFSLFLFVLIYFHINSEFAHNQRCQKNTILIFVLTFISKIKSLWLGFNNGKEMNVIEI